LSYFIFDRFIKIDLVTAYQRVVFSIGLGMRILGLLSFIFAVTAGLGSDGFCWLCRRSFFLRRMA